MNSKVLPRQLLVAALGALVAALATAGCAQPDKQADAAVEFGDGSSTQFLGDAPKDGRGAISGVIVDEAIRPLEGVKITLLSASITATTDDQGRFFFSNLDPGSYFLHVAAFTRPDNRASYDGVQSSAVVEAGKTAYVRVALASLPVPQQPYHETLKFDWFRDAGAPVVDLYYEWANTYLLGGQLPPNCAHCHFEWTVAQPVAGIVLEGFWQDSVPHPTATQFYYYLWGAAPEKTGQLEGNLPNGAHGNDGVDVNETMFLEYNSTAYSLIIVGDITSVTVNQAAQIFVTNFYVQAPPKGWSFVNGDA